jgi:hypothetical protein
MALMRRYIDKRTIAGLAADGTATYAHGLINANATGGLSQVAPDVVFIRFIVATAVSALHRHAVAVVDATNVTIDNAGGAACQDMELCAISFHSMIQ